MILNNLKKVIQREKVHQKSLEYIKIALKEELIYYALNFIYNSPQWNHLIFGGGTALKILGKTARLSEDLDMDYDTDTFDHSTFLNDIKNHFKSLGIKNIQSTTKQNGKIITLKFPILKELGIIKNTKSESDFLFLKIEIEKNQYRHYRRLSTPIIKDNLFFVTKSYDFESLFANKIGAIFGRKDKVFLDKYDFKGRDFYDLIWFLEKGIKPNIERLKEIIQNEHNKKIKHEKDVWDMIRKRIHSIDTNGIYDDMKNLVQFPEGMKQLSQNYKDIYETLLKNITE